jgi:hypothetical protein
MRNERSDKDIITGADGVSTSDRGGRQLSGWLGVVLFFWV